MCSVSGLAGSFASAQGTLTQVNLRAEANAHYVQGGPVGNFGVTPSFSGTDFVGVESRAFGGGGFAGKGFAHFAATFTPSSPMINGNFSRVVLDACSSAEVTASRVPPAGPHTSETAYGLARGVIDFSLSKTVDWTWIGGWHGKSYNTGAFNRVVGEMMLIDLNSPTQYVNITNISLNGAGDWSNTFSLSGRLGPGHYQLVWSHESLVTGGGTPFGPWATAKGGSPLVICTNSTFEMVEVPAPSGAAVLGLWGLSCTRRRR
jgi:hypothetical protein